MRELHGVTNDWSIRYELKRQSLIFDGFTILLMREVLNALYPKARETANPVTDEEEYLLSNGFLTTATLEDLPASNSTDIRVLSDHFVRHTARKLQTNSKEVVPLLFAPPKSSRSYQPETAYKFDTFETLRIAISALPAPGSDCAWQDILDFKEEIHDKLWHFRRFLFSLATKKQTEAEIRDDIEWSLNEYAKAMELHNLKAGNSFVEVYVVPAIELIEDIAKLNWSKIAKGALSVKKRQVELMEAEMKAPGREVAYIYDAQKRFGT